MRIGLTGGLGSGKTTVLKMFAELGAHTLSADDIARNLMQPGQPVYHRIIEAFGDTVLQPDGTLNRPLLARIAFQGGMVETLNKIVHPATIAHQEELTIQILARDPNAIVIVESALIFETSHSRGWRNRFDHIILVRAAEATKIARFVSRSGGADVQALETEARRRLATMIDDDTKAVHCDFVITNDGDLPRLRAEVHDIWKRLRKDARPPHNPATTH
jgi:dephospho-CoA kinase